jgi:hypothetical protein
MDVINPESLLLNCSQCGAWPMAVLTYESYQLVFRCPKCHARETYRVGVAGRLIRVRGSSVIAGGWRLDDVELSRRIAALAQRPLLSVALSGCVTSADPSLMDARAQASAHPKMGRLSASTRLTAQARNARHDSR